MVGCARVARRTAQSRSSVDQLPDQFVLTVLERS